MTTPFVRDTGIDPAAGGTALVETLVAISQAQTEVDGLSVNSGTGWFTHRQLIPGWVVTGRVETRPEGLVITLLAVAPDEGTTGRVTAKLLREVPVAALLAQIRQRLQPVDDASRAAYAELTGGEPYWPRPEVRRRPGRPPRTADAKTQDRLRRVALAYLAEAGKPGVHARLARRFRVTPDQIKSWIRTARADGWLGPAVLGARGADPGPRLLAERDALSE